MLYMYSSIWSNVPRSSFYDGDVAFFAFLDIMRSDRLKGWVEDVLVALVWRWRRLEGCRAEFLDWLLPVCWAELPLLFALRFVLVFLVERRVGVETRRGRRDEEFDLLLFWLVAETGVSSFWVLVVLAEIRDLFASSATIFLFSSLSDLASVVSLSLSISNDSCCRICSDRVVCIMIRGDGILPSDRLAIALRPAVDVVEGPASVPLRWLGDADDAVAGGLGNLEGCFLLMAGRSKYLLVGLGGGDGELEPDDECVSCGEEDADKERFKGAVRGIVVSKKVFWSKTSCEGSGGESGRSLAASCRANR